MSAADHDGYDLTAAAQAVLRSDRGTERGGALMVWMALTGATATPDAIRLAESYAAAGSRPFIAYPPPL